MTNSFRILTPEVWPATHHSKFHSTLTVAAPRCISLPLMWRHIALYRRHQNQHVLLLSSFFCCYQATWSYKGRGKRGARERTCVGRGGRCVKIKGCRQSKKKRARLCSHNTPPKTQIWILFIPGRRGIHHVWLMRPCSVHYSLPHTVN